MGWVLVCVLGSGSGEDVNNTLKPGGGGVTRWGLKLSCPCRLYFSYLSSFIGHKHPAHISLESDRLTADEEARMKRYSLYRQNDVFQGVGGAVRGLQNTLNAPSSVTNMVEDSSEVSAVDEVSLRRGTSGTWGSSSSWESTTLTTCYVGMHSLVAPRLHTHTATVYVQPAKPLGYVRV